MSQFAYVPLTEEELWRNAGLGPVLDKAAAGDAVAVLLIQRLKAADAAMQPEIDRLKAEIEREWMEGAGHHPGGLASLLRDEAAK